MKKVIYGSLLLLGACGGGGGSGGSGGSTTTTQYGTATIAGLWDMSEDVSSGVRDEIYLSIAADGKGTLYDYAGDTYDEWGNCYWIDTGIDFVHVEQKKFKLGQENVEASVSNNKLTLKMQDVDDIDDDSNTLETISIELPRLTTKKLADLKPECSDSMSSARALIPAKGQKSEAVLLVK